MSQISTVQQAELTDPNAQETSSGVFRSTKRDSFIPLGILGSAADRYWMPKQVLLSLAQHLGGGIATDLPPFFIACTDGMLLVVTLHLGDEYMGSAILLSPERMGTLDRGILELWSRLEKDMAAEDFLKDTAFKISDCMAYLPTPVERDWKQSFC